MNNGKMILNCTDGAVDRSLKENSNLNSNLNPLHTTNFRCILLDITKRDGTDWYSEPPQLLKRYNLMSNTTIVSDLPSASQSVDLIPMPVEEFLVPDLTLRYLVNEYLTASDVIARAHVCRTARDLGYAGKDFMAAIDVAKATAVKVAA